MGHLRPQTLHDRTLALRKNPATDCLAKCRHGGTPVKFCKRFPQQVVLPSCLGNFQQNFILSADCNNASANDLLTRHSSPAQPCKVVTEKILHACPLSFMKSARYSDGTQQIPRSLGRREREKTLESEEVLHLSLYSFMKCSCFCCPKGSLCWQFDIGS